MGVLHLSESTLLCSAVYVTLAVARENIVHVSYTYLAVHYDTALPCPFLCSFSCVSISKVWHVVLPTTLNKHCYVKCPTSARVLPLSGCTFVCGSPLHTRVACRRVYPFFHGPSFGIVLLTWHSTQGTANTFPANTQTCSTC